MPVRRLRGQRRGGEGAHQRAQPVHRVQDAEPAVGVVEAGDEGVGLGVHVGDGEAGEEEGQAEDGVGGLPEVERVGDDLARGADDQDAAHPQPGGDVGVGEGGDEPAGEIDEVHDGDEKEVGVVGGADRRDQGTRRTVCAKRPSQQMGVCKLYRTCCEYYLPFIPATNMAQLTATSFQTTCLATCCGWLSAASSS